MNFKKKKNLYNFKKFNCNEFSYLNKLNLFALTTMSSHTIFFTLRRNTNQIFIVPLFYYFLRRDIKWTFMALLSRNINFQRCVTCSVVVAVFCFLLWLHYSEEVIIYIPLRGLKNFKHSLWTLWILIVTQSSLS